MSSQDQSKSRIPHEEIETQKNISSTARESTSFRRKGAEQSGSDVRNSKIGRSNRPSDRQFDQVSVSSTNKSNMGGNQDENQKMMTLSNQARDALISMQRFDRFIYVVESQKKLKVPIEAELKRLEKIKNSGNKLMKNTFFDNELTITCLYNHMKNLYEISKELGQIVTLKQQIEILQQKIIEQNVKFNKQLKQATTMAKGKAAEDQQTLKDTLKIIDTLIFAMKEKNVEKGRKKIQSELKRAVDSRKELLELVHSLLGRVGGGIIPEGVQGEQEGASIYQHTLSKLIQDQGSAEKNLAHLNIQKLTIQKGIKESKNLDLKNVYTHLKQTCGYLNSLNTTVKETEANLLAYQKKATSNQGVSQADKQKLKQFQQLESIISTFEQDGLVWHKELELINIKVERDENFVGDLNKNKKLLTSKKQINLTVSSLVNSYLNLLQLFSKKSTDAQGNRQLQDQYNRVLATNEALQNDLKKLRKQFQGFNPKGQAQVTKLISMLTQALTLKEGEEVISMAELQKVKKYIQLNRRKIPEDFQSTLNTIEILIRTLIESEQFIKQKELQNQKSQQAQTRQISNLDTIIKTLQKLLFSNDPLNDGFLNKLKKNVEQNSSKIQKFNQSPLNDLFKIVNKNTVKLIQLLSDTYRNSKSKGEVESDLKLEIEQLRAQFKTKQAQNGKLNKKISEMQQKISQLEKQVNILSSLEVQLQNQLSEHNKQKIALEKKLKDSDSKIQQYKSSVNQLKHSRQSTDQTKDGIILELRDIISGYEKQIVTANTEIDNLNQQIQDLNGELALAREQLNVNSIQFESNSRQLSSTKESVFKLKQQLVKLNQKIISLNNENISIVNENEQFRKKINVAQSGSLDSKNQMSNLLNENENLKRQLNNLSVDYNSIVEENDKLKRQLADLHLSAGKDKSEFIKIKQQYSQLQISYDRDRSEWTKEGNFLLQSHQQKQILTRQIDALQKNYNSLQSLYNNQTQKLQQFQRLASNQLQSQSTLLKNKIAEIQSRLNKTQFQNNELLLKSNAQISQISSLQNQNKMLETQLRERNTELQKTRINTTTIKPASSGNQYDTLRYLALKEENIMLKQQIVQRDNKIIQLQQTQGGNQSGTSHISHISNTRDQQTIHRLESQIRQLRSRPHETHSQHKLINQNRELSQAVKIRQINLQNALGDNDYLYRELNKYKDIEAELQSRVGSLNGELTILRANISRDVPGETLALRQNISVLSQERSKMEGDIRRFERELHQAQMQINTSSSEANILKQKIKILEQTQQLQRRTIEELKIELKAKKNPTNYNQSNSLMEKKLFDLESTIKELAGSKNNTEFNSIKVQNTELKERLRHFQSNSRIRQNDDQSIRKTDERMNELLKEKLQYVKTIKQMKSVLHSKDVKLLQMYDQREIDLRRLIHQNKKLQEEINRINQRLVQQKVKMLISPKSIEQSLSKMENELIELKRENVILKEQIQTLEHQLIERDKSNPHLEVKSSSNLGLDKNLHQRVRLLEAERIKLTQRITFLSIYQHIETQSEALVSNVNKLLDGVLVFLNDSEDFADCDFGNNQFLPMINECLTNEDYEHYFENVEELFKDLFLRVVGRKNEILDKQAQQLLLLREKMEELLAEQEGYADDDSYTKSFYDRPRGRNGQNDTKKKASLIALQHLFKLYLKAKDPAVLKEISQLLTISQGRGKYYD